MAVHPPDPLGLNGRLEVFVQDLAEFTGPLGETVDLEDGLACFLGFSNVGLVYGGGQVLVVDVSSAEYGSAALAALRERTQEPIAHIVYTHRHGDHVAGAGWFTDEGSPEIWAHERLLDGWRRYRQTHGWQRRANLLQYAGADHMRDVFEARYVRPTRTFVDRADFLLGDEPVELHHAKGETDDHCWVWLPERQVALVGDVWIGSMPNPGNPQKVQRYVPEWADALDAIAALRPRWVVPGHGLPLGGDEAVDALTTTAAALRFVHDEVVRRLNDGMWPGDVLDVPVRLPAELEGKAYLAQVYGCVPFIVRDVLRRHAGWWSGDGTDLFPAPRRDRAGDLVEVAGVEALAAKAEALLAAGEAQRALHVAEVLYHAGVAEGVDLYVRALEARAQCERSLIGRNLLVGTAARVRNGGPDRTAVDHS